ncbi:unnamed protein product [Schistocephalus solidus]|uniref:Uncharacterized protein n=1 Tax=Schistocephalus solidus TaxID=70667 RepID=A0A183SV11_SCHSO|nr:unnamed protein product [Schistocephalus solidus]
MPIPRSEAEEPSALKTLQPSDYPYPLKNTLTVSSPTSIPEPPMEESPSESIQPTTKGGPTNQEESVMLESTNVRGPFIDSLMEDRGADLIPSKDGATPNDAGSDLCSAAIKHDTNQKTDLVACSKCTDLETGICECLSAKLLISGMLVSCCQPEFTSGKTIAEKLSSSDWCSGRIESVRLKSCTESFLQSSVAFISEFLTPLWLILPIPLEPGADDATRDHLVYRPWGPLAMNESVGADSID